MCLTDLHLVSTGLMIMASHRTFSSQNKHMSSQIKFSQTNLLYIINGNFIGFVENNECPVVLGNIPVISLHCGIKFIPLDY